MKKPIAFLSLLLFSAVAALAATYTPKEIPNVQLADSMRLVTNPDSILSYQAESQINQTLLDLRRATTAEMVVVVVDNIDPEDVDTFATDLFTLWGLGKKDRDNGVLLLVAKDIHRYVIRTGYGVEGILPDVVCARIGRNILVPAFRKDDYDGGLIQASSVIAEILKDPAVRDEILSKTDALGAPAEEIDWYDVFIFYCWFALGLAVLFAVVVVFLVVKNRSLDRHDRYVAMRRWASIAAVLAAFTLGLTALVWLPLKLAMRRWRNGTHRCPNCRTRMNKLSEEEDNDYLTPAQDAEERFKSVDYDVWQCPTCGETDVYAYSNPKLSYTVCPKCRARTNRRTRDRIIHPSTEERSGQGVHEWHCLNCGYITQRPYRIPKRVSASALVGGAIGSSFSGGGSGGGGGFGGGSTGGGGASGGW